ncbi:speckle-type POZ protein B-like [Argiope bruennichi]|uniref:speckle-type POZ protein B-like n=1 Tax=Argiope bruennichi TaxID=94029 RepID=UPI0024944F82|nr:speckle-type POZ protein B-like [Argiope bruennichi]
MASNERVEKCFTFLWKLENISLSSQKKGEPITSPAFVVDAIQKTKWKLYLYPRGKGVGNGIACFLNRETDSKGTERVEIEFDLAFITEDGSVLKSHNILKHTFPKGGDYGFHRLESRENVFISRRAEFLPRDTLTARCRIWNSDGEMLEDFLCSADTRIGVKRRSFLWKVENFSSLESEKKITYLIKSIENDAPLLSIDLSLTGGLYADEIIRFDLSLRNQVMKFCTLKLFLVDASGSRVECNQDEFWFDSLYKQFTFSFTKKKLLSKKSIYLPGDILSLHWELAFSKGVVFEEVHYGSTSSENEMRDIQNINQEKLMPLSYTLNASLKSLYDKQFLCDIKLKTSTKIFPAHKIILSASSSVFNAMFSNDMKERDSECVNIEDLSDDTVRRMLLYIYTASMDDVTWESASHLYVAADRYAILSLKNICSSYLKDNLSPSNACEVLLLADFHADDDLKSAVQDYILKHDKDIINSDEWKMLMETNGKLAAETVCLRYK